MPPSRSQSDPIVPPAKAHPLPAAQVPVAPVAATAAPEQAKAADTDESAEQYITPLHQVDQEIAEEADRLLDGDAEAVLDDDLIGNEPEQVADDAVDVREASPVEDVQEDHIERVEKIEKIEEVDSQPAAKAEPAAAVEPQPEPEPVPERASAEPEKAAVVATTPSGPALTTRAPRMALAGVVTVLMLVNYPMKLLPESAKTIFNWFALSLLLWVPAVWFIAIFVVGR